MTDETSRENRRPLISHNHQKRSLIPWILPLAAIIAVMVFLPKLVSLLEK